MKRLHLRMPILLLVVSLLGAPGLLLAQERAQGKGLSLTRAEKEDFLRKARVVRARGLSEGITNSIRATLSDGRLTHDAHIQTVDIRKISHQTATGTELNFRDSYEFNLAAYHLDRILGLHMVPVTAARKFRGSSASFTWWVDDVLMTEKQRFLKKIDAPDSEAWNDQIYAVRIFDQLIYNTDRNLGNLVITQDWTLWMIDHTRAFRLHKSLAKTRNIQGIRWDRKLLAGLRALRADLLQQELGSYLNKSQIQALLKRRDLIVKLFDEEIARRGEDAVLCDIPRT